MKHSATAVLALAFAIGLTGAAAAQSWVTGGPTPSEWQSAVPGPLGPSRTTRSPYTGAPYATQGYGSSAPSIADGPMTSPDSLMAPFGAGGIATGGQYFAR
jgi:hypothetical protein